MHIVGALIGVHRFEVHHVTDHLIFAGDAIAAMHITGNPREVESLAADVALDD